MSVVKSFPVEKEFEKNPDISREDIRKLREWLKTQPHLPEEYITDLDLFLIFFCCEKSAEVSKQVLDLHYTIRTHLTSFFKDRQLDKKTIHTLNTVLIAPLPMRTAEGYKAVYSRLLDGDPKNYMFGDIIRTFTMIFDLVQQEEGTWPGFVIMIDMDQTCLGHLGRIDLTMLKQVLFFYQECMLVKLKSVHFLNAPNFMDRLMTLMRPFLKKSLLDMIKVHERGSGSLQEYVPARALPADCGGGYKDFATIKADTIRRLEVNYKYFEEESRKRVNESLRPNGKKTPADFFGVQGSFKKLEID